MINPITAIAMKYCPVWSAVYCLLLPSSSSSGSLVSVGSGFEEAFGVVVLGFSVASTFPSGLADVMTEVGLTVVVAFVLASWFPLQI